MKYILISNRIDLKFSDIPIYHVGTPEAEASLAPFREVKYIALDIETTGLDVWENHVVLVAIYNPSLDYTLVIDTETVEITLLNTIDWKNKVMIAHSAAFEAKFLIYNGVMLYNVWCTLVAEQKILQGAEGFSMSLVNSLDRRKIEIPEHMDKDIRMEFTQEDYSLRAEHILYNASDVLPLHELMEKQKLLVEKFQLNFFLLSIHMPLILVLTRMELEGFSHNSEKWIEHADKVAAYCEKLNFKLNVVVVNKVNWQEINSDYKQLSEKRSKGIERSKTRLKKLKDTLIRLKIKGKENLKSFRVAQESYIKASEDLEKYEAIKHDAITGINWASSKQVLQALTELDVNPLPKAKSSTTHKIQPSTSVAARESWLLNNKHHRYYELMEIFDEMQGQLHNVKSFGRKWVDKYTNPVTGKVHTTYRNDAATGRLTSGAADMGLYNSQQIPAPSTEFINAWRHCFVAEEGYSIFTGDYTGAELCFMCVLAEDHNLIALSKQEDMHSHFANKGWEAIYESRGIRMVGHQVISKNQNKNMRTDYKPMMFGTVYGLRAKKAAEILNVSIPEGQIAINTITEEIPDTIKMVEEAVAFAKAHGYVIHNTRTNSRRWFTDVLFANKDKRELTFMENMNVEGAARNTRIQGSQADLIMEALVAMQRWIDLYQIDAKILLTVHDEIVIKFRTELTWFGERAAKLMENIAILYTKNIVDLKVDHIVESYWTK